MTFLRLDVEVAGLPCAYKDGLRIAPGAFGWVTGGKQWAALLSLNSMQGMPIGRGGIYEQRSTDTHPPDGIRAELLFDLERVPAGGFPHSLPEDPDEARKRMTLRYRIEPIVVDQAKKLITKARLVSLWVGQRDPSAIQIEALLEEREQEQDGYL